MSLIRIASIVAVVGAFALVAPAHADAQAGGTSGGKSHVAKAASTKMPLRATARCTDSTWTTAATQQGACSSHGGVATWFGARPRGATARCNDGQYWTTAERQGACSGHGGVATWYKTPSGKASK